MQPFDEAAALLEVDDLWVEFILPSAEDAAWEKLGWRTELHAAAAEARALQRPVLLWAMPGHPCGLT